MALHTHLPLYKLTYDLLGMSVDLVRQFPRDIKATLGATIRDECVCMLVMIARANAAADKVPHITKLLEARETVELLLRTCHDKRFIGTERWADAIELLARIGQQAGGWRRQQINAADQAAPEQPDAGGLQGHTPDLFSAAAPAA